MRTAASLALKLLTELVGTFLFLSVIALAGPIGPLAPLAIGAALTVLNVAVTRSTQALRGALHL